MKKIIMLFVLILFTAITTKPVFATDNIIPVTNNSTLYYSPSLNLWSITPKTKDKIKITKRDYKYYINQKLAFTLKSDFNFISNNQFATVDNNTLKFYALNYDNSTFLPQEMSPNQVQTLFKDIKVIPISQFENQIYKIKREPFKTETYLLVNDTAQDFTGYRFSPTSVQRTPIKGIFLARNSNTIRFRKESDNLKQEYFLTITIKNDQEKMPKNKPVDIKRYPHNQYPIFSQPELNYKLLNANY